MVPNSKNPPKIKFEKFVKLTDLTCACNDLTNFECEAQATGNGSYMNLKKLPSREITWANLCFGGFSTFGTTVGCEEGEEALLIDQLRNLLKLLRLLL